MTKSIKTTMYATAIGLGILGAAGLTAQAQSVGTGTPNSGTNTTMTNHATTADAGGNASPDGTLEKFHGQLRASELEGANVFNDQGTTIGTVQDLLVGDDGKIQNAVLSVGGFLGMNTHYVSVPFTQLQVQPSRTNAVNGSSGGTGTTTPVNHSGAGTGSTSDRFYSVVLPGATKDSLTKMPEFNYRS